MSELAQVVEEEKNPQSGSGARARGFAAMSEELQRQIASQGGRTAHKRGVAHEFTPEEARRAGRKGGEVVSRDRTHMARIGHKGAVARSKKRNKEVVPAMMPV